MLVFVKLPSGKTISVEVEGADSISSVKGKVNEREGLSSGQYRLIYKGKQLSDGGTVSSYNIGKEATVHLAMLKAKVEIERCTTEESHTKSKHSKPMSKSSKSESEMMDDSYTESYSSSSTANNNNAFNDLELTDELKAELLSSFALSAESSNVEIIFSFDTTGSMASCLGQVRAKVSETVTRLIKDVPNIRIGIIAHGDYCDDVNANMRTIEMIDLSDDVKKICSFVNTVTATGGGDAPEAYELALRTARKKFSWTPGYSKALVMIGDEVPHVPSFTTKKINWKTEVDKLADMGVKIYGVRALNCDYAAPFYEEMSQRTGTVSITFQSFNLIVDMFLAICYREASGEKLKEYQEEVKKEGKMTEELNTIFETLSKPNPEKKTKEEVKKLHKCTADWYLTENDNGRPSYEWDKKHKRWVAVGSSYVPPKTTTTTTTAYSSYPMTEEIDYPGEPVERTPTEAPVVTKKDKRKSWFRKFF